MNCGGKQLDNFKDWQTYFKNKVAQSIQIIIMCCGNTMHVRKGDEMDIHKQQ